MPINTFGITAEAVRAHHFPNFDAVSTQSRPTLSVWTEVISECAGELSGALSAELVDGSAITDTTSPAYLSCRRILRMWAASRLLPNITGADAKLGDLWAEEVGTWLKGLADGGATFLGAGASSSGTSDPDGPTSHLSVFGLEADTATNMSSTIPPLRKDDQL